MNDEGRVLICIYILFYFDDDDDGGSHGSSSSNGCSQHLNNTFIIQMIPGACDFVLTQKIFSFNYFFFCFFNPNSLFYGMKTFIVRTSETELGCNLWFQENGLFFFSLSTVSEQQMDTHTRTRDTHTGTPGLRGFSCLPLSWTLWWWPSPAGLLPLVVGLLVKPSELGTARVDPPAPGEISRSPISSCQRVNPRLTRSRVNLHTRAETLPLILSFPDLKGLVSWRRCCGQKK